MRIVSALTLHSALYVCTSQRLLPCEACAEDGRTDFRVPRCVRLLSGALSLLCSHAPDTVLQPLNYEHSTLSTTNMQPAAILTITVTVLMLLCLVCAQLHPTTPARYQRLPSLREQAASLDGWRDERVANIPALLTKYRIDAWLVSAPCSDILLILRIQLVGVSRPSC